MILDRDSIQELIEEGRELYQGKHYAKAFFPLEKAYHLTSEIDHEVKDLLIDSAYRGIWAAYAGQQYELMEYLSTFTLNFIESNINQYNTIEWQIRIAKTYNGLALSHYELGKRNIEYNLKSDEAYNRVILSGELEKKDLKEVVKSKIKNDFGLIINLGFDGDFERAITIAQKDINLSRAHHLLLEEGLSQKIMGNLLFYKEDYEKSFEYLLESMKTFQSKQTKDFNHRVGEVYLLLCENHYKLKQYQEGKKYLDFYKILYEKDNQLSYLFYSLSGEYFESIGSFDIAWTYYYKSATMLNISKWGVQFETNMDSFLKHKDKELIYLKAISGLFLKKEDQQAIDLLENYRSKLFVENVLSGRKESLGDIPADLKKERESIVVELINAYSRDSIIIKDELIVQLEKKLYLIDEKIALTKGSYRAFSEYTALSIKEIQEYIPMDSLVIGYFYYGDNSFIYLVSKGIFKVVTVNISSTQLEELFEGYLNQIKGEFNNPNWETIDEFYRSQCLDYIINPIINDINAYQQITLIPYKILHTFPLHILFLSLKEDITISYLPNLQSIRLLKPHPIEFNESLILGDPRGDLRGAQEEVKGIQSLFNHPSVYTDREVQKNTVLNMISQYTVIHYSGHIRYNYQRPLYSYLECSSYFDENNRKQFEMSFQQDQSVIYLKEIYQLNLENIHFLSLSGCSSGRSTHYRGEEMVGMLRGFFFSGVQSILATLWDVEDLSSRDFLVLFYQKTLEHSGNKKKGFLEAYHTMKNKYKHPFFYGGFILYESI